MRLIVSIGYKQYTVPKDSSLDLTIAVLESLTLVDVRYDGMNRMYYPVSDDSSSPSFELVQDNEVLETSKQQQELKPESDDSLLPIAPPAGDIY